MSVSLRIIAVFFLAVLPNMVHAAFITTKEAQLDAIYSQANFGSKIIDIRIGTATELVYPEFLDITASSEVNQLFSLHQGPANVVNFYFIDTISACGSFTSASIVGCGEYRGNDFVVESTFAAGWSGAELLAHELGHNLGLPHLSGNYLMNPSLNRSTLLTPAEITTIFLSPLVQNENDYYWIDINPVLIVAAATTVDEPASLLLFMLVGGMFYRLRRQRMKPLKLSDAFCCKQGIAA
ncbi:PEP-CTERM sorting domain-containing protein [Agarivorans sp. QJM3NY_33]|uniref:PEP-CTERM sorting domain-containing protein n=1 Tax=Agarivorans sp. QJM3NY_33 TaxID=3421432 RepID=UPI003D7DA6AA